jgi:hypothetical protein
MTLRDGADQLPQTPGTSARQVRPPYGYRLPLPGVSDPSPPRRTAQRRARISPVIVNTPTEDGFAMTDPYVRRFWVAAIGPGAVADLLRLAAAAHGGRSLPMPTHISTLLANRLAFRIGGTIGVPATVAPLPHRLRPRLAPRLRGQLIAQERARPTTATHDGLQL